MTDERVTDHTDPETETFMTQPETFPVQAETYPSQSHEPGEPHATETSQAGVTYARAEPATYTPPYDTRNNWPAQTWQQQTPPHWLEPLPGQDRRQRRGASTGYLALVVVIALIA